MEFSRGLAAEFRGRMLKVLAKVRPGLWPERREAKRRERLMVRVEFLAGPAPDWSRLRVDCDSQTLVR
jgi:hypothetical protein